MHNHLAALAVIAAVAASPIALAGDAAAGQAKAAVCAGCHGTDGNSPNPMWPKLAGQHARYLEASLKAFRAGVRKEPTMNAMAAPLSDEDIANLAAYFAAQKQK